MGKEATENNFDIYQLIFFIIHVFLNNDLSNNLYCYPMPLSAHAQEIQLCCEKQIINLEPINL